MTDQGDTERLQDENLRLRSAVESSLIFAEEVLGQGQPGEGIEAKALIAVLNEALAGERLSD